MLTINSISNPKRIYFFESLGFLIPEHFKKGLFVKVPCEVIETSVFGYDTKLWEEILRDCDYPELYESYRMNGLDGVFTLLKVFGCSCGTIRVHIALKIE